MNEEEMWQSVALQEIMETFFIGIYRTNRTNRSGAMSEKSQAWGCPNVIDGKVCGCNKAEEILRTHHGWGIYCATPEESARNIVTFVPFHGRRSFFICTKCGHEFKEPARVKKSADDADCAEENISHG